MPHRCLLFGPFVLVPQVPIGVTWSLKLTDDFNTSSVGAICGKRVISYIVVSRTRSCMVLTRSMATTNQETRNPPNTLERQVQTLATMVEGFTQRNHELEGLLEQRNDQEPNDQKDGQDMDKRDDNRPPTNDYQERND